MSTLGMRFLLFWLPALLLAACGPEAPPRAAAPTSRPPDAQPTVGLTMARPAGQPAAPEPAQADQTALDPRALGDPNAPITVIEYGDYQWPFCDVFVRETKPQLEQQYIATGKVYFVYRDFPLVDIHASALLAAHVANCAGDQGSYWPMHDRLFQGAGEQSWGGGGTADFQTFLGYADELRLDVASLQQCVETNRHAAAIEADFREAAQLGVRSTPSFLVNGRLLVGAQPYATWRRVLDDLLAKQ